MPRPRSIAASAAIALFAAASIAGAGPVGLAVAASPVASSVPAATVAPTAPPAALPGADARVQVDAAIAALQANPADQQALLSLGDAAYQLARETADPAEYARADDAFTTALAADPTSLDATLGLGTIALARHDFAAGLELGQPGGGAGAAIGTGLRRAGRRAGRAGPL